MLVVIGVTAVLAAIVAGATLAAAAAEGAAGHRAQQRQAETFARGALLQLGEALEEGYVAVPGIGATVRLVNGAGSSTVGGPGFVPAPVGAWPPLGSEFNLDGGSRGVVVEIERVTGPDGAGRGPGGEGDDRVLLIVRADAWFRTARVERTARFAVGAGEAVLLR
ncbi:MAG: hypothetical protein GKS06_04395 [Acidobacteria bacterium]|nr:hypothetical protein [Acidobacteriota bacterium]